MQFGRLFILVIFDQNRCYLGLGFVCLLIFIEIFLKRYFFLLFAIWGHTPFNFCSLLHVFWWYATYAVFEESLEGAIASVGID